MVSADAGERPDTHHMVVVHRALRREAALLPEMVRAAPEEDVRQAVVTALHFRDYELGLRLHHAGEDELLWPLLRSRVNTEKDLVQRIQDQHKEIVESLAGTGRLLRIWEKAPSAETAVLAADTLSAHRDALLRHLSDKEEHILPLISEHLTVAEWELLKQRVSGETPRDKQLFFLGAVLEDADEAERAQILSELPGTARLAWRVYGRRRYSRQTGQARAWLSG